MISYFCQLINHPYNRNKKKELIGLIKKSPLNFINIMWNGGEFKHEVRQFEKSYDNQQAEQISLMV